MNKTIVPEPILGVYFGWLLNRALMIFTKIFLLKLLLGFGIGLIILALL
ncbi:MAG: hypothetical protein ACLQU4_20365 [Limisphaerales bacterium]